MAYEAVDSLRRELKDYLDRSDILLDPDSREILEIARKELKLMKATVTEILLKSTSSLDLEMKVAISKLEEATRSHISMPIDPETGLFVGPLYMELQDLKQAIHSTTEMLKQMDEEYAEQGGDEDDDDDAVSSIIGVGAHSAEKVRSSPQYVKLKDNLMGWEESMWEDLNRYPFPNPQTWSLVGMPGIGKTTLAMEIFKDPKTLKYFNCLAWVTVGRKYRFNEIGRCILAEVDPDRCKKLEGADEDCIARTLQECLKGKRYLVVLDDVRNKYMTYHLRYLANWKNAEVINPFPKEQSKGIVLLTTRIQQEDPGRLAPYCLTMTLLNKEESWDLLREKVFGEESCPFQLEKHGREIAEICCGLPLTIITVAELLSTCDPNRTPEFWSKVAEKKQKHEIFKSAYNETSKVLYSCYKDLTQLLKLCFLYMCIFSQNYEIPRSKIITMWNVDGFLQINAHKFPCPSALECLEELVSNNLVMIYQNTFRVLSYREQIKTCGLHASLWYLSCREARKSKFALVLDTYDDCISESIKSQSRLSFHNNILLGFKEAYKSVEDNCASTTHSLQFYGSYHQYQVPLCFGLELLKELDALTIRFYEFPTEVLQLVELRYLALTMYGKLPISISQLSNLQFLIVGRHFNIKYCNDPSFLPVEIWNMKELKHIQVMGIDLPDPCGTSLESLETLKSVSAHSCTESILRAIPNLQKLGIQIELGPSSDFEPLSCFNHISVLENLSSLKCVVVNPKVVPAFAPLSIFSTCLKKLSLSGLGYPWEELNQIASSIPQLKILKLRNYAFRGPIWEVKKGEFQYLKVLIIEDTDLVEWATEDLSFFRLKILKMKHCYKLEKINIHPRFGEFCHEVELVDCNPLCVKQLEQAISMEPWWGERVVRSSWET